MLSHSSAFEEVAVAERYSVGDLLVEVDTRRVFRGDKEVHLTELSFDVFVVLLRHAPEVVSKQQLMNEAWQGLVIEPETVKKRITLLRESLTDGERQDPLIRVIRGRGYALNESVERLPEGLKRDADVVRKYSLTQATGKKLQQIILVVLALALAYFAFDKFVLESVRVAKITEEMAQQTRSEALVESYGDLSIAVLPFVNMSSDPEQEYFSDGISEELLSLLSEIPEMRVISRSSAFTYKGKDIDIPTVAKKLNVTLVLEGSVRKTGNQVRISAQLIEARSDTHLWSETYDRELENTFMVQDEISAAIVGALKQHLGIAVEMAPQMIAVASTDAHDAYLRGRYLVVQRTSATVEGAVREFRKAIEIDPDYARAHAELAIATLFLNRGFLGEVPRTEAITRAAPHAEQAMALDPNLAEAHAATGMLLQFQAKWEAALAHYQQAIQLNPNYAIVYNWMAIILGKNLGQYTESFAASKTALRLDPLSITIRSNYTDALLNRQQFAEFDQELEKLASIAPDLYVHFRTVRMSLGGKWANEVLGSLDSLRIGDTSAGSQTELAMLFAIIDLEEEALTLVGASHFGVLRIMGRHKDAAATAEARFMEDQILPVAHQDLGLAFAGSGDYARARPILEEEWKRSGQRVTCCYRFRVESAAALIAIRRDAGEEDRVGELLAAIRDDVRRLREADMTRNSPLLLSVDFEEGLAAYLDGKHEKGLALIAKAAEDGHFILPGEDYLQTLYDDPGFAPIREGQKARQARERDKFLTVVCKDNPYAAVWQPAEGTCEQLAATYGE
jgi:TolB-like protein/DNA-binding winged helix-turn-helix (wHTH) protein/Tfp pilus assembly protein PilF